MSAAAGALPLPLPRARMSIDPELVAFCDANHDRIVGLMAGLVTDRHVAEDLAQEAFLRCHTNWLRLRGMADREAWLRRVAVNLANSWWRRRYSELRANRRHSSGRPEITTPETANRMAVRAAVASLPKRQRTVIALRYFGGLSVAETAEVMRCREGTVKSLTAKGMASLRNRIGREAVGPAAEGNRSTWNGSREEGEHAGHR